VFGFLLYGIHPEASTRIEYMDTVFIAIIFFTILGLVCSVLITIASKLMFVKVDPRLEKIRSCLPGANCGACGFSGCEVYAEALIQGDASTNLCPPGGDRTLNLLNQILGVNEGALTKMTAIVHCLGDSLATPDKFEYIGIYSCFAAEKFYGGKRSCSFGCIGFGDCMHVCPNDAICIENKLARIDPRKCSGCGVCLNVCPTKVIALEVAPVHVAVLCKNTEKGSIMKDKCTNGCIGCTKCVRACDADAIKVSESLAVIDYTRCTGCGKCKRECIKKCIH